MGENKMGILYAPETIDFFKSYGFRVDEESVREWVKKNNREENRINEYRLPNEDDLINYNVWCSLIDTAYEEGIDNETKIERLLEEVFQLRKEIEQLHHEKQLLKELLGINEF